jgi:hypothetical protein
MQSRGSRGFGGEEVQNMHRGEGLRSWPNAALALLFLPEYCHPSSADPQQWRRAGLGSYRGRLVLPLWAFR